MEMGSNGNGTVFGVWYSRGVAGAKVDILEAGAGTGNKEAGSEGNSA